MKVHSLLALLALAPSALAQSPLWMRQIGTPFQEILIDANPGPSGGVYLTGTTSGDLAGTSAGSADVWVALYDSTGNEQWSLQAGTSGSDWPTDSATDGQGRLWVAGHTAGALVGSHLGSQDGWLTVYDAAGNPIWSDQLGTSEFDAAMAVANGGGGSGFVGGFTNGDLAGPSSGFIDGWLASYTDSGQQLWIQQFGTAGDDSLSGLEEDGAGGVFGGGHTTGAFQGASAGGKDAWIARYDSSGNPLWVRQIGTSLDDECNDLVSDGAGGVYLVGRTEGSLGGINQGSRDVVVARYDGFGNQLWIRQFGGAGYESAAGSSTDGAGGLVLCGTTYSDLANPSAGEEDAFQVRFDSAGNMLWLQQLGKDLDEEGGIVALGPGGTFYVGGFTSSSLAGPNQGSGDYWLALLDSGFGATHCAPGELNSTGQPALLLAQGSAQVASNNLALVASSLPQNFFGYLLTSLGQGFQAPPAGSQGRLCLGSNIGRYIPSTGYPLSSSGSSGSITTILDLGNTPTGTGPVAIQPGETRYFQFWYRDFNPGPTSNFTGALGIEFQ